MKPTLLPTSKKALSKKTNLNNTNELNKFTVVVLEHRQEV